MNEFDISQDMKDAGFIYRQPPVCQCGCVKETDYFCPTCFHNFNHQDSFYEGFCPLCHPNGKPPHPAFQRIVNIMMGKNG